MDQNTLQEEINAAIQDVKESQPEPVEQEEVVQPEEPVEVEAQPAQEVPTQQQEYSAGNQENVRELRELRKRDNERANRLEHERNEALAYIQNIQQAYQQPQAEQNDTGVGDDEYVNGKHFHKVNRKIDDLNNQVNEWKTYSEDVTARLQLNSEFPDFNDVVNSDSIHDFKVKYPEMKSAIESNDTLYNRAKLTYRLIKKFNKEHQVNVSNKNTMNANVAKPIPSVAVQERNLSPLSQAHARSTGNSEEYKQKIAQDMYDIIDNY